MAIDVGQPAPDVTLPAATRDGVVSLGDHRGKHPVLLALFRGLYCPFCRSQIARLGLTAAKLRETGVETLGVIATPADRTRLYFRSRPAPIPLGADPDLRTHRAYGVPGVPLTPDLLAAIDEASLAWARELGIPTTPGTARDDVQRFDGYEPTVADHADFARHQGQMTGQFLIDRDGIVRWLHVQRTPREDFPSEAALVAAVKNTIR